MHDSSTNAGLFQYGRTQWLAEPHAAFDDFLQSYRFGTRALRPSSAVIYRGMFRRLMKWAGEGRVGLFDLNESALESFLQAQGIRPETRHRYLLVFRALFAHLDQLPAENSAPAAHAGSNPALNLLLFEVDPKVRTNSVSV